MTEHIINLKILPVTSNQDLGYLNRPKRMTLEEFNEYEVTPTEQELRKKIYALEEAIFGMPEALSGDSLNAAMTPIHRFTPGLYTRELLIPPGQIVVGKRHAVEHQVMLTKGSCYCITERGIEHMTAPMHFVSPAGEKRIVITSDEEAIWVTMHPTEYASTEDLDKIEDDVIISEPERMKRYMALQEKNMKKTIMNTKFNEVLK